MLIFLARSQSARRPLLSAAEVVKRAEWVSVFWKVKPPASEGQTFQGLLQAMPEEELLAEVYRDRVLTLVPLTDKGSLVPEAVEDTSSMSEQARAYQAQVTGAPKGWCYKVCRNGKCVEYDGFDPTEGVLLEGKARGYEQWFDEDLNPVHDFYGGLEDLLKQAARQYRMAAGQPIRWHVAEPRMVAVLRKHFGEAALGSIEVVYTAPVK